MQIVIIWIPFQSNKLCHLHGVVLQHFRVQTSADTVVAALKAHPRPKPQGVDHVARHWHANDGSHQSSHPGFDLEVENMVDSWLMIQRIIVLAAKIVTRFVSPVVFFFAVQTVSIRTTKHGLVNFWPLVPHGSDGLSIANMMISIDGRHGRYNLSYHIHVLQARHPPPGLWVSQVHVVDLGRAPERAWFQFCHGQWTRCFSMIRKGMGLKLLVC